MMLSGKTNMETVEIFCNHMSPGSHGFFNTLLRNHLAGSNHAQIPKLFDDFLLGYALKKSASTQTKCHVIEPFCNVQDTIKRETQLIRVLF